MAKYSLWIIDDSSKLFCVPLSRNGQSFKEKVDLYEIDLLTVSLGKECFIEQLKKSDLAPCDFNWNHVQGHIEYQANHETHLIPLLFEKDDLLIKMLNFQNKYRSQQGKTETQILNMFQKGSMPEEFSQMLILLSNYRDFIINKIRMNPNMLKNKNLSRKMAQKIYSCIQSTDYDEQIAYKNDILTDMLSYLTFRRMKATEYGCHHVTTSIIDLPNLQENALESWDPDEEAFLTEEEKRSMYG